MHDSLDGFRKYFRWAALGCSVASALLTLLFGLQQSPQWIVAIACAGFFVICSLASDYIALFVSDAFKQRSWVTFGLFAAGGLFVFSLNLMSNLGSVGWQRDVTITQARVQNTKADMAGDEVSEGQASLKMWTERLAKLEGENAWLPSVTATALRAQLASANLAIEQEAKRGGCGPKCLGFTKARDDIASKIALAEEKANLTSKIEATKLVLSKHREKAASTDRVVAAPLSQASFFAGMVNLTLNPSEDAETWTTRGMASWIALGLCIAPILFSMIGWRTGNQRRIEPQGRPEAQPAPTQFKTASFRDMYNRHCRAQGVAPVAA